MVWVFFFLLLDGRKVKPVMEEMNIQMRNLKIVTMETPQMRKRKRMGIQKLGI